MFITPLATISGWLCLRGAVDHLHFSSRLEAVGLIALTVALFTIYLFWTLVSMAGGPGFRPAGAGSPTAGTAFPLVCSTSHLPCRRQTFKCWREHVVWFITACECPCMCTCVCTAGKSRSSPGKPPLLRAHQSKTHSPRTFLSSRSLGLPLLGGMGFAFSCLCSSLLLGLWCIMNDALGRCCLHRS